jgi:uncharacterized protein with von Willebrand factor type A (vWA) domain
MSVQDMDLLVRYCGNDLDATQLVYNALRGPLELRRALGEQYGMNLMSKSDSQVGEAIIKREVERVTKTRVERIQTRDARADLKALRNLGREGQPELNLRKTIRKTADNAGDIGIVFERGKRNRVQLVLLMDTGGSTLKACAMPIARCWCTRLPQTTSPR